MSRSRATVAVLALVLALPSAGVVAAVALGSTALVASLALPSAALAQGAGDEQYNDPFGGEQTQGGGGGGGGGGGQDDGLSDEPPVPGGGGQEPAPAPQDPGGGQEPARGAPKALPNTGSDPRVLAFVGLVFVLTGVGLRLRTIDPDAY